jgi:DNA-binding GntR family transcriptional regulator
MVGRYQTLHEFVENSLRNDIIAGVFAPGSHLHEEKLTERYEVSRGPIREVLRALEAQGIVTRSRSKGVRVAELSVAEMEEIYELRVLLEGLAAERGVENATPEGITQVKAQYERLRANPGDTSEWLEANNDFHCAIYGLSGRAHLLDLIRQLMRRIDPYMRLHLADGENLVRSVDEHEEIWKALVENDAKRCAELTRQHLATAGALLKTQIEQVNTKTTDAHERA